MVQKTMRPSDTIGLVGVVNPASLNGTGSSGWFSIKDFAAFMAVISAGAAPNALNAKIEQATDEAGTGAKDVTGKAITELNGAGSADDQAIIEFDGEDFDVDGGFAFARLTLETGGASIVQGAVYGCNARYGPASDRDLASVVEIVGLDA